MKYTQPQNAKDYGTNKVPVSVFAKAFVGAFAPDIAAEAIIKNAEDSSIEKNSALTNRGGFLPLPPDAALGKTRTIIAFDWISWTGKKTELFLSKKQAKFKIDETATGSIKDVLVNITGTWEKVANLWTELGAGIDKTWCQVKLENKFCYQSGRAIVDLVMSLNHELGITFKNYTRLDVCCDFQSTDYRNFTPQDFLRKVAIGDYTFKGKKYQDKGEAGKKISDNVDAEIDVRGRGRVVESIRVGQRKSGLSISMYNKTKEMKSKGEKPWISEQWREAGFYKDMDTFRIEFSYMKDASVLASVEKETGEVVDMIEHEDIKVLYKLDKIFRALYTKHFVVSVWQKNVRFSRRYKVELLALEKIVYIKTRLTDKLKSTNITKCNIRAMLNYAKQHEELGNNKIHASEVYRHVQNIIEAHCGIRDENDAASDSDLWAWFKRNFPDIDFAKKIIPKEDIITVAEVWKYRMGQNSMVLS